MSMTAVVAGNHSHVASAVDTVKTSEGLGFLPPCLPNFSNLAWGGAVSAFLIGALIGSLAAARIAAKFGRKWTLVLVNLISTPGYILVFFSMNVWMFSIGRLFLGIGAGALATTTSVYLGEIAPARTRGAIGAAFHLSMTCGMLVAMVCGNFMSTPKLWRPLLVLAMFFSIMQVATMPFAVESPRWLVFKGRFVAAKRALRKIRGVDAGESALEVDKEFAALLDGLGVKDLKTKVQDAARAWFSESEMKDMSDSSSSTRSSRNGGSSSDAEDGKRAPPSGVATGAKDPSDSPHEGDDLFVDVEEDIGLGPEDDELFGLNHHAFEEDEDDLDEDDDQSIRPSQDSARGSEAGSATPRKSGSYRRNRLLNNRVTRAVLSMFELLTTKALHKHIFLVCLLQIALPLCGVSAINMYSSTIFSRSFQQSTSLLLTAILGPVLLVSSLIAIPLVDNIGRKPLLVGSFLGMMLCCIAMAVAGPFAGVERMSEADMIYAGSHTHRMLERSFGAGVGGALLKTYDEPFLFDKRDNLGVLNRRQAEDGDGDDDQDDDGDQDGDGDNDVDVVETEDVPMMENPDDKKQVPVKTGKQVNMVAATVFVAFSYIFVAVFSGGLGAIGVMILPEREFDHLHWHCSQVQFQELTRFFVLPLPVIPLPAVMSASTLAAGLHWTFSILVSFLVPVSQQPFQTPTFQRSFG